MVTITDGGIKKEVTVDAFKCGLYDTFYGLELINKLNRKLNEMADVYKISDGMIVKSRYLVSAHTLISIILSLSYCYHHIVIILSSSYCYYHIVIIIFLSSYCYNHIIITISSSPYHHNHIIITISS